MAPATLSQPWSGHFRNGQRLRWWLALALAFANAPAAAQSVFNNGDIGKLRYDYQRGLGEKARLFSALSYEEQLDSEVTTGTQSKGTFEAGVSYTMKDWFRLEAGLGNYYSSKDVTDDAYEVRLWQAATFDWPEVRLLARWVVHHRFMLEERFQHTDDWDTSFRGRYRLSFTLPVNRFTVEPGAWYMPLAAEWFWNPEDRETELFTDARTVKAGLGYQASKDWAVELNYTWQESRDTVASAFTRNDNIIELRVRSTIRIRDYLKIR